MRCLIRLHNTHFLLELEPILGRISLRASLELSRARWRGLLPLRADPQHPLCLSRSPQLTLARQVFMLVALSKATHLISRVCVLFFLQIRRALMHPVQLFRLLLLLGLESHCVCWQPRERQLEIVLAIARYA